MVVNFLHHEQGNNRAIDGLPLEPQ